MIYLSYDYIVVQLVDLTPRVINSLINYGPPSTQQYHLPMTRVNSAPQGINKTNNAKVFAK